MNSRRFNLGSGLKGLKKKKKKNQLSDIKLKMLYSSEFNIYPRTLDYFKVQNRM